MDKLTQNRGTMLDYLDWRNDVPLALCPFNDADNLVLCQLSYLALQGIVPSITDGGSISVAEASKNFFEHHSRRELYNATGMVSPATPFVLQKMAQGQRFSGAKLSCFESRFDEETHEQFAALTIELSDATVFLAFRGTDDTLVGWREDFEMCFTTVPAQRDALSYLTRVAELVNAPLRIGGHSKGGNLAAYAGALCPDEIRARIEVVYCNDSPGFAEGVVPQSAYALIEKRIKRFVPEFCIIGAILEQGAAPVVVHSKGEGLMQHSALNWQMDAAGFVRAAETTIDSRRFALVFDDAVTSRNLEERKALVDAVFDSLTTCHVQTMHELASLSFSAVGRLARSFATLDDRDKEDVEELVSALLGQGLSNFFAPVHSAVGKALGIQSHSEPRLLGRMPNDSPLEEMEHYRESQRERKRKLSFTKTVNSLRDRTWMRSALLAFGGLLIMANAESSAPAICYAGVTLLGFYSVYVLVRFTKAYAHHRPADVIDLMIGALLIVIVAISVAFPGMLVFVCNMTLGAGLGIYGFMKLRKEIQARASEGAQPQEVESVETGGRRRAERCKRAKRFFRMGWGMLSLGIGVLLLINPSHLIAVNVFAAGLLCLSKGVVDALRLVYERTRETGSAL